MSALWPDSDQTQELLLQAREGDSAAINDLMERHRKALRRMVALRMDRQIAGRVDASDIVQDVLVEANRRLSDFIDDGKMPFHLWLRQLAKDRLIDMHRRHHAQRRSVQREQPIKADGNMDRSSMDLEGQLSDPQLTPAAANIRKEQQHLFWAAIEQLGEQDREIILMRHAEHLGNSEVAEALKLSPAAAGMRYLRAMRRLRTILKEGE